MAEKKISELDAAASVESGALFAVVNAGGTEKATDAQVATAMAAIIAPADIGAATSAEASAAQADATQALSDAADAQTTADTAVTNAATAQTAADDAQTDATQALSDADGAQTDATAAGVAAAAAQSDATDALVAVATKADAFPTAPDVYTGATLTLEDAFANYRARVSSASNAVAIKIPTALTGGDSADTGCFECTLIITDATTNAVTISTGAGLLTPKYASSVSTITADNTLVAISVVRGVAYVAIVETA